MRLVNELHPYLNTKQLREELYAVAKIAGVSLRGILVLVRRGRMKRRKGRGTRGRYNGYITLWFSQHNTWDDLRFTFAHELSHLIEWRGYGGGNEPRNSEKRADAFADDAIEILYKREPCLIDNALLTIDIPT